MKAEVVGPYTLREEIEELWRSGLPQGEKTGWPSVDKHYSVAPGQLTVVTGWPGSGKSEWLDAMLVHLAHQGWRTAMFSPENHPVELHISKIMEKVVGLPFGAGPNQRMVLEDVEAARTFIGGRFGFVKPEDGQSLTAQDVIEIASPWLQTHEGKKRGLVIDPWNELEHWRPKGLTETEYISQQLSFVRNWARHTKVHVWIVAHPQKMIREAGKLPIPRPDMIAGSQHWWNKADNALTVWRNMEDHMDPNVDIHVQKVRFKHIGRIGVASLRYDRVTGRYHEIPNLQAVKAYANKGEDD